jgi:hypothetical protein
MLQNYKIEGKKTLIKICSIRERRIFRKKINTNINHLSQCKLF